jgi:uncharacterized membrane protein YphA (DoxX/SURF4 family)
VNSSQHIRLSRWLTLIRIFLGLVFIFSSVVKGIDPIGTSYRVEDYLLVYGLTGWVPYALWIAFLVITSEFLIGIAFLFKLYIRTAAYAMLLILIFFTVVTFFDALYNLVPDCGCFGDAVKLSNWQTFDKNILLLTFNFLFLRFMRKEEKIKPAGWKRPWLVLLVLVALFQWFMFYNLQHLPVIDFRNWKTGRNMAVVSQKPKTFVTYRNKKTGIKKEFLFPHYPWKDSIWRAQWVFVSQRRVKSKVHKKYNVVIEDSLGNDVTRRIIEFPGFQWVLVSFDLHQAQKKGLRRAAQLQSLLKKKGISMVLLTATDFSSARRIESQFALHIPIYQADETDLKAMIRSNPGLILLHNGVILKKWHFHDFPNGPQAEKLITSSAL